jgi:hypothetical protein
MDTLPETTAPRRNGLLRWIAAAGLLAVVIAGAWFYSRLNPDRTWDVVISQGMIDEVLAKKFPKEKTYGKFLTVTYLNPRAVMEPTEEKVRVNIEMQVAIGYLGIAKTYRGSAELLTKVGYQSSKSEFFLHDAELVTLELPKLGRDEQKWVREGVNWVAAELLDQIPVYQLKQRDFKTGLTRLLLKRVVIRQDHIVATFGL